MTGGDIIQLVIAAATCAAAVSAWLAAKAARAQVKLQEPRPVIVIEGKWPLENNNVEQDGFLVRNLGSSPAFDISISDIEGPLLPSEPPYRERLITEQIPVIADKGEAHAIHHRCLPNSQIDQQAVLGFVKTAGPRFPIEGAGGNRCLEHDLHFSVTYSRVNGTQIKTKCVIRFNLGVNVLVAHVAPVSSWLGEEIQ